jgi:NNP family nitrate/nitrite transporter-like MFS transporter
MASQAGFVQGLFHSNINPSNHKSRTLPLLNIKDKYGRTFHLSWIGFFVAFLSWFAFPPLLHGIIQKDLQLTQAQIANSNIIGLLATLLVRLIVGPLCDKYGPRYVMVGCLLVGAIPTALTPVISNASGLIAIRFFVGILGGTFVPCQVWTSQFFDKNIIGLTNALAAGLGNAGGGVTYFLMPAVVSSLMNNHGMSQYWAWRLAFPLCPLVIILCISAVTLIFGHDSPTGSWSTRHLKQDTTVVGNQILDRTDIADNTDERIEMTDAPSQLRVGDTSVTSGLPTPLMNGTAETSKEPLDVCIFTTEDEIPRAPTATDIRKTVLSLQTLLVALPYLCSFGSELAVEGIISDFYIQTAKMRDGIAWNYQTAGNWAAVFGLLNIVTRPLGGYISDVFYRYKGVTAKKWWLIFLGIMNGIFFIWIGFSKLKIYSLIGAMTGLAIFMEAANGAIFALVPAIHPKFNGVVSGVTGASGNIGGILFNLAFRFLGTDYHKALWIIGIFCLGSNLAVTCIPIR